ncbi:MAG: beta-lactamase family protein [Oscillospiraceae bacterium]|jgi:CubicO group peptidase (beta-lactamase class C family)|nr:beta-lactamase family protein [Oscillospiraceae bacterium]
METIKLLRKYVNEYLDIWPFSGVISVYRNGQPVFESATGKACREFDIDNTMDTCFSLGSISKQFTAFSIMQLFDKRLMDIDKPANDYLPKELQIDPRITPHHLMSHTSGLHQFYNWEDDFFGEHNRDTYCRQDYFDTYINKPVHFTPGSQFEYNNAGYNILAWIVENISGLTFGKYLFENIFKPLGMENSALDDGLNIIPGKAFPYQFRGDMPTRCLYYNEKFSIGASAVVSNCRDLIAWYKCLKNRQLLSSSAYKLFFEEHLNGYCYGLFHDKANEKDRYYHGGDHFGVMAYIQYFFDEDVCMMVMANQECGNHYRIGDAIRNIYFENKYEPPQRIAQTALTEEEASLYEGTYLAHKIEVRRNGNHLDYLRCNGEIKISMYPAGLHQFAKKWEDQGTPSKFDVTEDGRVIFQGFEKT